MEIVHTTHLYEWDEIDNIWVVEIDGLFYVVRGDDVKGQVSSVLPADQPASGGCWIGRTSEAGVKYVATGRSRKNAMAALRRLKKNPYS